MGNIWWLLAKNGGEIIMEQKNCRRISGMLSWQPGENDQKRTEEVLLA